jgi:membrane protein DedA with SNARE-associated domain
MTKREKYIITGLVIAILCWSVFLYIYDTQAFVEMLGAKNGYIIMFLVALFGGVSSLGAVTYITTLLTLASGGLSPMYLAIASGIGVSFGDTVYFYLGKRGLRKYITQQKERHQKIKEWIEKISSWFDKKSNTVLFFGIYLLTALTPIPNDITAMTSGLANRSYIVTVTALVLGNMTYTFLIATFGKVLFFL